MVRTTDWDNELLVAAEIGDLIKVRIALENGANPNAKNNDGWTPLHIAANKGHVDVVRVLLVRGADPNAKDNTGHTPLHWAAIEGHVEIVKLLLEYGADPRIVDNEGRIPLDYAKDSANRSLLTSKSTAYFIVELAYRAVLYSNDYKEALFWIEKINTVDTKDVISSLKEKIEHNIGTKEDILKKIELLRNQIGLSNN